MEKKIAFLTTIKPQQVNAFICKPKPKKAIRNEPYDIQADFVFKTCDLEIKINHKTGLIDCYKTQNHNLIKNGAFKPIIIKDNADSWAMFTDRFNEIIGEFTLANDNDIAEIAGLSGVPMHPIRIIEDGPVFTPIPSLAKPEKQSKACQIS